ncbi:hypothetical protein EIP91_009098 [Steccherinum ochraceum]|uniref:Uncharacterized protein n=1 Tax=Steccherinum ochraceum TaxID=92696 RepID=A0A4R0RRX4_9APHY|nr:hypothetical protein EIP91_009098 [Steccherinum ochraceum]
MRFTAAFATFAALACSSVLAAPAALTARDVHEIFARDGNSDLALRNVVDALYARELQFANEYAKRGALPPQSGQYKPAEERLHKPLNPAKESDSGNLQSPEIDHPATPPGEKKVDPFSGSRPSTPEKESGSSEAPKFQFAVDSPK